ncbi:MAG: D-alanyl-D-alanine carboxypeptidase/D-alanyl-D-alanine-endopeptidase [Ignavibacteriales bacterium]|nr:MAG: D-alanyl-D-alanine carboxypeptidase/D-alanyl-D-alanine-endopeptidase [Ignavibacteriales bacterium]
MLSVWQGIGFSQVKDKLNNLLSDPFFESTIAAVDVYDLTNKEIVYQKNNKYLLHPASNMKILTTAAGLFFLGPDYFFETTLYYHGEIEGNILRGDIYVVGGFDPEFITYDLEYFAAAIDSLGIKEITGNLYADVSRMENRFWGEGWMWDDDPSTDAPYLSSLNINLNSVDVFLLGADVGENAQVILNPHTEFFEIFNETITIPPDQDNSYYITRDWMNRKNTIMATGKVNWRTHMSGDEEPVSLNVYRPDLYFLTLYKEALQKRGIKINGTLDNFWLPYGAIHLKTFSRPVIAVIRRVNKVSSNLHAEMVLYAMAEKYYGKPATSKNGIKVINNLITMAGMNPEKYRLVDGSGLSHYNLVSAELILAVLKHMYYNEPELYKILNESFPVSGIDGTLGRRMGGSNAENRVNAKTGTLSGVSALSGYLAAKSGRLLAFSILMQNFVNNTSTARSFQDEICKILTEY